MKNEVVFTKKAPPPGAYSQAIRYGDLVFVSGQTSEDPITGKVIHDSVAEQTERILNNIKTILEAAGSSMDKVLKCTIFISAMEHKAEMNRVYKQFFPDQPPARITVAVAGLDDGLDVEIDAIAGV